MILSSCPSKANLVSRMGRPGALRARACPVRRARSANMASIAPAPDIISRREIPPSPRVSPARHTDSTRKAPNPVMMGMGMIFPNPPLSPIQSIPFERVRLNGVRRRLFKRDASSLPRGSTGTSVLGKVCHIASDVCSRAVKIGDRVGVDRDRWSVLFVAAHVRPSRDRAANRSEITAYGWMAVSAVPCDRRRARRSRFQRTSWMPHFSSRFARYERFVGFANLVRLDVSVRLAPPINVVSGNRSPVP